MDKTYTIVRFTLVNKRTRAQEPCWLSGVTYAPGDGLRVKKMTTTRDRAKAAPFSLAQAHAIAEQFSQYPASLEKADGTPLPEETARLRAEQARRHAAAVAARADVVREFNEAFAPLAPLLAKAIERNR